jgi:hypothetical protein
MRKARHFGFLIRLARLAAPLAVAASTACASGPQVYQDEAMDFGSIQRIALMPLANLTRETAAAERVRDVLASKLLSTGAVYVLPPGEVTRAISRAGVIAAATPSVEEIVKLGQALKVEAIVGGTLKEYGEVRSGSSVSNVISLSLTLYETTTGKAVWSAATTKGGVTLKDRLLGGGGSALNDVTEEAVNELVDKMLK